MLYKVYDGFGNLVISTADFDFAWDVGMKCGFENGIPRLVIEHSAKPAETLPFEPVPYPSRLSILVRFFCRKKVS